MTYYERIKLSIFGVSLAPIRILCFAILLALCSLVSKISIIGLKREQVGASVRCSHTYEAERVLCAAAYRASGRMAPYLSLIHI